MFAALKRLCATSVSPVAGLTADHPCAAPRAETAARATISPMKMKTGSGNALPTRSTTSSRPRRLVPAGTSPMPACQHAQSRASMRKLGFRC